MSIASLVANVSVANNSYKLRDVFITTYNVLGWHSSSMLSGIQVC